MVHHYIDFHIPAFPVGSESSADEGSPSPTDPRERPAPSTAPRGFCIASQPKAPVVPSGFFVRDSRLRQFGQHCAEFRYQGLRVELDL